jgi:hypothetical protein
LWLGTALTLRRLAAVKLAVLTPKYSLIVVVTLEALLVWFGMAQH